MFSYNGYFEHDVSQMDSNGFKKGLFYAYKDGISVNDDMWYKFIIEGNIGIYSYYVDYPHESKSFCPRLVSSPIRFMIPNGS